MVDEIRIYLEGGGEGNDSKAAIRRGMHRFLRLDDLRGRTRIQVVACGGRRAAYESWLLAKSQRPQALNLIVVDSEEAVNRTPWEHLRIHDRWACSLQDDLTLHLMTQVVEAWLLADKAALIEFYGQGFRGSALPENPNVEDVDKATVLNALENATRTTLKGKYHKIQHCGPLLERIDPARVRSAAPFCDRLLRTIEQATTNN